MASPAGEEPSYSPRYMALRAAKGAALGGGTFALLLFAGWVCGARGAAWDSRAWLTISAILAGYIAVFYYCTANRAWIASVRDGRFCAEVTGHPELARIMPWRFVEHVELPVSRIVEFRRRSMMLLLGAPPVERVWLLVWRGDEGQRTAYVFSTVPRQIAKMLRT